MPDPASIRYNNPGAMWGGNAIARKWGATANIKLNDGLNQGNTIAFFPDKVHGAAAQFDLWRSRYCNMLLRDAIRRWSGGNWSAPYAEFLTKETGLSMTTMIDLPLLASRAGWILLKAQAQWEAGRPYPLSDAEWQQAQALCFGTRVPVSVAAKKTSTVVATTATAGTAATTAAKSGASPLQIFFVFAAVLVVGAAVWFYFHKRG